MKCDKCGSEIENKAYTRNINGQTKKLCQDCAEFADAQKDQQEDIKIRILLRL